MSADRVQKFKMPATLTEPLHHTNKKGSRRFSSSPFRFRLFTFAFACTLSTLDPSHHVTMAAIHPKLEDLAVGSTLRSWEALKAAIEDHSITKKLRSFVAQKIEPGPIMFVVRRMRAVPLGCMPLWIQRAILNYAPNTSAQVPLSPHAQQQILSPGYNALPRNSYTSRRVLYHKTLSIPFGNTSGLMSTSYLHKDAAPACFATVSHIIKLSSAACLPISRCCVSRIQ